MDCGTNRLTFYTTFNVWVVKQYVEFRRKTKLPKFMLFVLVTCEVYMNNVRIVAVITFIPY